MLRVFQVLSKTAKDFAFKVTLLKLISSLDNIGAWKHTDQLFFV